MACVTSSIRSVTDFKDPGGHSFHPACWHCCFRGHGKVNCGLRLQPQSRRISGGCHKGNLLVKFRRPSDCLFGWGSNRIQEQRLWRHPLRPEGGDRSSNQKMTTPDYIYMDNEFHLQLYKTGSNDRQCVRLHALTGTLLLMGCWTRPRALYICIWNCFIDLIHILKDIFLLTIFIKRTRGSAEQHEKILRSNNWWPRRDEEGEVIWSNEANNGHFWGQLTTKAPIKKVSRRLLNQSSANWLFPKFCRHCQLKCPSHKFQIQISKMVTV